MKTNELNQQELQSTNGGQMMPPPPGGGSAMPWIWPEQANGYIADDGQQGLTQDSGTSTGDSGVNDDNGGPYIR